jgi:hypothetical protein
MTPDEIGKATTPNALRRASADQLDDLSNHATSLLLDPDAGNARQSFPLIFSDLSCLLLPLYDLRVPDLAKAQTCQS